MVDRWKWGKGPAGLRLIPVGNAAPVVGPVVGVSVLHGNAGRFGEGYGVHDVEPVHRPSDTKLVVRLVFSLVKRQPK